MGNTWRTETWKGLAAASFRFFPDDRKVSHQLEVYWIYSVDSVQLGCRAGCGSTVLPGVNLYSLSEWEHMKIIQELWLEWHG